ncbi:uncharacterized protein (TIGR04222 family) [Lentzea atacamensis]|uniref:Uncharacterized protein (TIGR04222 family) n=1 Tax=Lentzea atacamensis TaxID=531938 RepID=A0ABX9E9C4_9PSEU|nr:TIGR04222 domain-containing membrane protein [Lentzea atacamensis]RAS64948.1 uncharacterized protein (TIGR04222 family) [Lentzea atacamensis]
MTTHTPEELGCLAGGPARAAEVALARLLHAGLVRISREGVVTAVHLPGRRPATPLEAQILNGLRGRRYLEEVLRDAAASAEAAGLRAHLADRGLLRRRRSWRPRLYPWLFLLGIGLVLLGFADLVFPEITGFLTDVVPRLAEVPRWAFFAAGAALIVWASALKARDPGRLRTRAGYQLVNRAGRHVSPHDPLNAVAVLGLRGRIGRVAVAGLVGLTPAMAGLLPARETSSSSSCGSGCSSSSCGGDSGGSGCGGGCGGGGGD